MPAHMMFTLLVICVLFKVAHSFDSEAGFLVQPNKLNLIRPSFLSKEDLVNVTWYENGTLANLSHRAFGRDSDSLHGFDPCTIYDSVITAQTVENSALQFQASFRDVRKPRTPKITFTEDHMLLVDWTSDTICKPVNYSVRLDEHSGSVRTHIIPGQVTKTRFTNVVGCNAVDICITASYSSLMNETTCVFGFRPKKGKPSNVKIMSVGKTVNISWVLQDSCQPDSYQVYTRKGKQSVSFHLVSGTSSHLLIQSPPECPPCVILVGAAYPELYNTLSDPVRWLTGSGETVQHTTPKGTRQLSSWQYACQPTKTRKLTSESETISLRIHRYRSTVNQHILLPTRQLRCPVLYYRVTIQNERENSQTYFLLDRAKCLPLITNEEASYVVSVKIVTTEGQTFGSDNIRFQINKDGMFKRVRLYMDRVETMQKDPDIL
ncbi:hypothetical protein EG68_05995 [Paragonimus skrjabini miyazakii]|uniref:Uncharacterized protein n=1 Tax=Paragonimus skrjabini miyazakii TaxID=59628 RepID=A0A8S9Z0Q0_9TREM|nr:hypothetical protein EG68_05995 [Paragonimus skrjabini miyazakii]